MTHIWNSILITCMIVLCNYDPQNAYIIYPERKNSYSIPVPFLTMSCEWNWSINCTFSWDFLHCRLYDRCHPCLAADTSEHTPAPPHTHITRTSIKRVLCYRQDTGTTRRFVEWLPDHHSRRTRPSEGSLSLPLPDSNRLNCLDCVESHRLESYADLQSGSSA